MDDYTVRFTLNGADAPFISNLAMDFASILSAEYADKMAAAGTMELVDNAPIGTGPFEFVSYKKDSVVRFNSLKDYWEGKPKIDRLIYAITTDPTVRFQKLKAGECHIMPYPNSADLDAMSKDPNLYLLSQEGLNVGYLGKVVEQGEAKTIFDNPSHPYTQALLGATPAVDPKLRRERVKLTGELPSPLNPPPGCSFHNRCRFAQAECSVNAPALEMKFNRLVACHFAEVAVQS